MTLSEVRILFDAVIQKYPITKERLKENARIVHDPKFESAIVKLQENSLGSLTCAEKEQVKLLERDTVITDTVNVTDESNSLSFAERVLKKRKITIDRSPYLDTRFILPTTNLVERMFSKAGYAFSKCRKSLSPTNL